jgi:hypothetical protein
MVAYHYKATVGQTAPQSFVKFWQGHPLRRKRPVHGKNHEQIPAISLLLNSRISKAETHMELLTKESFAWRAMLDWRMFNF